MKKKSGPAPNTELRALIYKLHVKEKKSFREISKLVKRSLSNVHELYSNHVRDFSTG